MWKNVNKYRGWAFFLPHSRNMFPGTLRHQILKQWWFVLCLVNIVLAWLMIAVVKH